jgi:hypothetical protein
MPIGEKGSALAGTTGVCHPIIHFGHERIPEIHHSPTRLRAAPTDSCPWLEST